jgi:hypothetical protein
MSEPRRCVKRRGGGGQGKGGSESRMPFLGWFTAVQKPATLTQRGH